MLLLYIPLNNKEKKKRNASFHAKSDAMQGLTRAGETKFFLSFIFFFLVQKKKERENPFAFLCVHCIRLEKYNQVFSYRIEQKKDLSMSVFGC